MTWLKRPRQEEPAANSTLLIFGVDPTDPESLDHAGVRFARAGQTEQAAQALLASARLGYPPGAYNYALVCEQAGRTQEAEHWYTFAAEHGHAGAANSLGAILFRDGDLAAALPWFRQASEAGDADGARNHHRVSDLLTLGEQEDGWRTAAERGDPEAGYQLGLLAAERGDKVEARRRYAAAATAGHALAANALAELLDAQGEEDAALPWYRIAADAGVRAAAFTLGITYGSRGEQCNLGSMLMAREDFVEAREWFERARAGGDDLAARALVELDRREGG